MWQGELFREKHVRRLYLLSWGRRRWYHRHHGDLCCRLEIVYRERLFSSFTHARETRNKFGLSLRQGERFFVAVLSPCTTTSGTYFLLYYIIIIIIIFFLYYYLFIFFLLIILFVIVIRSEEAPMYRK